MSILVVGSVALDTVRTPFGKKEEILGGSATYFSVSASFFNSVDLVAVVGADFPPKYVKFLRKKGIGLEGLEIKKGKKFRWEGKYDWDFADPQTISTKLNVFSDFAPNIPKNKRNSEYVFLANIDPEIQAKVLACMKNPKLVACDTMNYWIQNKRKALLKLIKKVDIFLLNESEARQLTGQASLVKAARAILKMGLKTLIIKKGEHGSILFTKNIVFSTPAYLMESIFDPTGAGDTFAGGVMGYLSTSRNINHSLLRKAIAYGSVMATFAVEDFSLNRLGRISKKDIDARYKKFRKLTHF